MARKPEHKIPKLPTENEVQVGWLKGMVVPSCPGLRVNPGELAVGIVLVALTGGAKSS